MEVHLVDGTYELFRHFFALPSAVDAKGQEIAATRGVISSVLQMLTRGATHIGVATDKVIESFRNQLYPQYKTGEGMEPTLYSQFPILEEALRAMGVVVWDMVEFEADDALGAAAVKSAADSRVSKVFICTPDKDLAQCVSGSRIVQLDRRRDTVRDEEGVVTKFGVKPESIPDYLALVGDTADGFPGLTGWGEKAASSVLSLYTHLEEIPKDLALWDSSIRNAKRLSGILFENWNDALLFRTLATLRLDATVFENIDELRWKGPDPSFQAVCERLRASDLYRRTVELASSK